MDAYSSGGGGKLKLKGSKVSDGRVKKKKSKKSSSASTPGTEKEKGRDVSADLISQQEAAESRSRSREGSSAGRDDDEDQSHREGSTTPAVKTEAERRHEEMRKKRLQERLKRDGVKTHKERVEELNKYLSRLSEHHDMPKIGPG
ncbi:hypothetical protein BJX62DRAFT_236843 [Aspergillus germanicus]